MKYTWIVKPFFWFQKRRYGKILPPMLEWAKAPRVMISFLLFYKSLTRKHSPLPPRLRSLVGLRISQMVECSFCINFNARHLDKKEIVELEGFRESILFSEEEKAALEYAEMIVRGAVDRTAINMHFSQQAVVELTAFIGCQLLSSRFNTALGVQSTECKR